jgi:hypothetical protein
VYSYSNNNPVWRFDPDGYKDITAEVQHAVNGTGDWAPNAQFFSPAYLTILGMGVGFVGVSLGAEFALSLSPLGLKICQSQPSWLDNLSRTDAALLRQMLSLSGRGASFNTYLANLNSVVQNMGYQIFQIGTMEGAPIYGSLSSGIGIVNVNGVTYVVRALQGQLPVILGRLP